ncbi:bifunctional aspartate kinase/diaminopimelate decarboxylase [Pleionea sp. CnH1-48]|uniref:bifunctional aspartate kinase/diaminopimelate decarboxylase n=1 Tax=Pleionea sp. CnH1-48 TaxID=2954494 RepID=UPI00209826FD|nr:bifunctional aspartate kinase/diaminopimelate decarboxylase [Pleionea sp. CnH1-48]MCO7222992.1 bifunctional aspartate kinase/diaminopimelate decarboxylase [Pleionea sp. CnH1-48]
MTLNQRSVVAKFGGTSVSSPESLANLVTIVGDYQRQKKQVLIVVSALSGVSNLLESLIQDESEVSVDQVTAELRERHQQLMTPLGIQDATLDGFIEDTLQRLPALYHKFRNHVHVERYSAIADIMSTGELLSSQLIRTYLEQQLNREVIWTDAREWLFTHDNPATSLSDRYLNAECEVAYSEKRRKTLSSMGDVVITQGFIACNSCGETVILGRGGSDTSATCLGALIGAEQVDIWTDVPGMFSANPRVIPQARQLLQLEYKEAQEIASTGAKVLHPRCLRAARKENIPVFVGSTFDPGKGGTLIGHFSQNDPQVKAISVRSGVTLISMETSDMWRKPGFLAQAFGCFDELGLSIDQVSTSETNVTVTLDKLTQGIDTQRIEQLVSRLESFCRVSIIRDCAAVSIVGRSIRMLLSQLSSAFDAFQNRSVHMLTQASNDLNFTFVINENDAAPLVEKLHDSLIATLGVNEQMGHSWQRIFNLANSDDNLNRQEHWWYEQRLELIDIAHKQGASYVYSLAKVEAQIKQVQQLKNIDRVFYAIKANPHKDILEVAVNSGIGLECVSWNEVEYVLNLFPDLDRERILFTPNFAPREEYEAAIEAGIFLTLDNLYPLQNWKSLFAGQKVLLRIDPGQGEGHHQHVKTAGNEAKFGIPLSSLEQSLELIKELELQVIGLHCHVGSGILTSGNWQKNGLRLAQLARHFADLKYIDLGGGLGIVERPQQQPLDLQKVDESLATLKQSLEGIELWMEPGRYIVAQSGVLLARVTQTKGKQGSLYLGVETGMNSLIRPALYGAYHPIVNLSRIDQAATEKMTVVGPICETADKLGLDRMLPESFEGDVMLIANAGAYGAVMSSQYNMRAPAKELTL